MFTLFVLNLLIQSVHRGSLESRVYGVKRMSGAYRSVLIGVDSEDAHMIMIIAAIIIIFIKPYHNVRHMKHNEHLKLSKEDIRCISIDQL